MCIYYSQRQDLTYTSEEHIILGGLGGIGKLHRDYVSTEFNNDISKLEQLYLRESIVSWQRLIVGPGKRGSLSEKKQSKSKVHILLSTADRDELSLGFVKGGKAYVIPHIILDTVSGKIQISLKPGAQQDADLKALTLGLAESKGLKIRKWYDSNLPAHLIIFGAQKDVEENYNAFLVRHESNIIPFEAEHMKVLQMYIRSVLILSSLQQNGLIRHM